MCTDRNAVPSNLRMGRTRKWIRTMSNEKRKRRSTCSCLFLLYQLNHLTMLHGYCRLFARAPTLREDGDGPVEQTTYVRFHISNSSEIDIAFMNRVEEIPIIEVPAYEAYNIQLSPTPGLSRRKRARSSSAEACSPSPRSPKRTRVGSSRSNASLSHNSGSQRANSHGTSGSHRGSNQGDEEYVVSMLESGSGESSHSQNSTRRRNARVEEVRVNHGSDGFLGGVRSSSVSHHANFESSSPGVGRSAPTPLSNGNPNGMMMDLGLTMDRVWYENPKDSDVDNAPPMPQFKERNYSVKGKQRAKA